MECLKCGKTVKDEQVFCPHCLEVMDAYPVKSNIPIQLPPRREQNSPKKARRKKRPLSPEEQIFLLRSRQRRLVAAIALLSFLLCAAVGALLLPELKPEELEWGKNYTFENPFD